MSEAYAMASPGSNRDTPASEEQQGLLQPDSDPSPPMGSDVTKPEGRKNDDPANIIVWVRAALRPCDIHP